MYEDLLHSSRTKLDPKEVPTPFHRLIDLAEKWGENDDILRERLIASAKREELDELANRLAPYEQEIFAWLSGPKAQSKTLSKGYIAFTALMMVYDAAQM